MNRFILYHWIGGERKEDSFFTKRECRKIANDYLSKYGRRILRRYIVDCYTGELMSKRYFLKNYDLLLSYMDDEIDEYFMN